MRDRRLAQLDHATQQQVLSIVEQHGISEDYARKLLSTYGGDSRKVALAAERLRHYALSSSKH